MIRKVNENAPTLEVVTGDDPFEAFMRPVYLDLAQQMRKLRKPLDAELMVSDFLGMLEQVIVAGGEIARVDAAGIAEARNGFLAQFVELARSSGTAESLATLRTLAVLAPEPMDRFAADLAQELADSGVQDRAWAATLGSPQVGRCWHYGDLLGQQDGVNLTFSYGREEHLLSVLIDYGLGGGIKDSWVGDDPERAWQSLTLSAASNPLMVLEVISWAAARDLVVAAMRQPVCAVEEDQIHDVAASAGVLRARMALLSNPLKASSPAAVVRSKPSVAKSAVLQLKVTLRGSKPPIWRRLEVPADITLDRLHPVLLIAFGWSGGHLHMFDVGHRFYGSPDPDLDCEDERGVKLTRVASVKGSLRYTYDFGDDWEHVITIEERRPAESGVVYPRCTGGRRAAPPDDCGGLGGYDYLLEVIKDARHPEHQDLSAWFAEVSGLTMEEVARFDPAAVDREEINQALANFAARGSGSGALMADLNELF